MQADVIDGTAAMDVDPQSRLLIRITPGAGGAPISLEVSGQPVVATGFPREQLPVGRTNVLQVIQQLIAGLTHQANAGIPGFLARLQALDQRDDRALADVMQGVQPATIDAINLLPAPVPAALAGLRGAANATGAWLTERARSRTRVLTGDEANSAAALNPDAAQHWVIAGPGGTGISAAEIILARSAVARVTMVGGNPTAGLLDNDQFRQVWRVHGPAGSNRFQVLTNQEIGSIATPDAGQHYTAGAAARGNQRLELPPPDVAAMQIVADQRWLVAARADLLPAVQRILGVAGTKVVIYGAVLPPDLHDAAVFRDLVERFGPAGQLRLQVLTGAYAANAQAAGPLPADGFQLAGPVQGDGYIAALGRTNQLSPVLNQLIRAARMRGPNNVRGELIYDADQQYIGYRIIIVAPDNSEKRVDVTGAASRFPPEDVFTEVERNQVTVAIRRQDAPSESGNFDGGFVASARQSARYGHHHRAEVEAAQVRDYRLTGNAGPLALRADQRAQWPAQVREFLARELRVDLARLRVIALGGGATGDPLFKVSVGEAELGVFKVFADQGQAQNELDQLNFLAGLHLQRSQAVEGVVGTQPVPIDAQQGRRGILMRTAPGRSVDQMVTSLPARGAATRTIAVNQIIESSRLVARALAEIHRMTNTGNRMLGQDDKTGAQSDARYILNKITADPNPRAAAVRHALGDATNAVVTRLQLRIDEMGAANVPACAYHGDANAGNFIIDGGTVRVIDVGNMRWSHAGADGSKSGANDVAKYLGSLETLHPLDANRLQADELQRIAEAFFAAYLAEFNQGGRNLTQADMTAAIVVFKVEQLIAAFHGQTLDNAAFRARMTGVLGL